MVAKRIIPCLDIDNNRTVKGVNFKNLVDAGDPIELARTYSEKGADELVFLDITATKDKRKTLSSLAEKISENINIPFTVGGGIRNIDDVTSLLLSGADKITINTQAVKTPNLINEVSSRYGNQCVVVAIDAKRKDDGWEIFTHGGRNKTGLDAEDWIRRMQSLGAGEILLTSMDKDGTKKGYDLEILARINEWIKIPIIASGGAGNLEHISDAFLIGKADAALCASIFHFNQYSVTQVKEFLRNKNIKVRI